MANYFIIGGDGKEYGPVTDADVRLWIAEGRLNAQSLAKGEGDAEFRALAQFPEFAVRVRRARAGDDCADQDRRRFSGTRLRDWTSAAAFRAAGSW